MIRTCTVKCPNCEADDTTNIELEDWSTEYFVVAECESCQHPYVIGVKINVDFRVGTIEMEARK